MIGCTSAVPPPQCRFFFFLPSEFDLWERAETCSANQPSSRHLLHVTLEGEDAADQPAVSEERNETLIQSRARRVSRGGQDKEDKSD